MGRTALRGSEGPRGEGGLRAIGGQAGGDGATVWPPHHRIRYASHHRVARIGSRLGARGMPHPPVVRHPNSCSFDENIPHPRTVVCNEIPRLRGCAWLCWQHAGQVAPVLRPRRHRPGRAGLSPSRARRSPRRYRARTRVPPHGGHGRRARRRGVRGGQRLGGVRPRIRHRRERGDGWLDRDDPRPREQHDLLGFDRPAERHRGCLDPRVALRARRRPEPDLHSQHLPDRAAGRDDVQPVGLRGGHRDGVGQGVRRRGRRGLRRGGRRGGERLRHRLAGDGKRVRDAHDQVRPRRDRAVEPDLRQRHRRPRDGCHDGPRRKRVRRRAEQGELPALRIQRVDGRDGVERQLRPRTVVGGARHRPRHQREPVRHRQGRREPPHGQVQRLAGPCLDGHLRHRATRRRGYWHRAGSQRVTRRRGQGRPYLPDDAVRQERDPTVDAARQRWQRPGRRGGCRRRHPRDRGE